MNLLTQALLQGANGCGLAGLYVVGSRRRWGFVLGVVSEVLWVGWGVLDHNPGIYPWAAVWAVINCRNWRKWSP